MGKFMLRGALVPAWAILFSFALGACGGAAPEEGPGADAPGTPPAPVTWAMATKTTGASWNVGVVKHADGSFAAAGGFHGTGLVAAGTPWETPIYGADASNGYVARIHPEGALLWVRTITGLDYSEVRGVTVTPDGATYVCGYFSGTLIFEEGRPGEQTFFAETEDAFLARYESDGSLGWVREIGGAGVDELHGAAGRPDGSVVVAGLFSDTLTLGAGTAGETTLTPAGILDGLVACFEDDGSLRWAHAIEGASMSVVGAWDATALPGGDVVVAGDLAGEATFGAGQPGQATRTSVGGSSDGFLARYDSSGTMQWVRTFGGADSEYVSRVTAAPDGSLRLTGVFAATATFGAGEAGETLLTSAGRHDGFVAQFAGSGDLVWVGQLAGEERDDLLEARVESGGTTLVAGTFVGAATLGLGQPGETTLEAASPTDQEIVLARYAPDGTLLWAKSLGGPGDDVAVGLLPLPDGTFVVLGSFQESLVLDGVEVLEGFFLEAGAFVLRLDSLGAL